MKELKTFFDVLKKLTLLRTHLVLKKINKIDGEYKNLGKYQDHLNRVNITTLLSRMNLSQVALNRYFGAKPRGFRQF